MAAVEPIQKDVLIRLDDLAGQKTFSSIDVETAISLCSDALLPLNHNDSHRPNILRIQASWLYRKYKNSRSRADLEDAARVGIEAAEATPGDDPGRFLCFLALHPIMGQMFEITKASDDLDHCIRIGYEVDKAISKDDPCQVTILQSLRDDLKEKFQRTKEMRYLEEAIVVGRKVTDPGCFNRLQSLESLRRLLSEKYKRSRNLMDLEDAILQAGEAVREIGSDSTLLSTVLNNLAILLSDKYSHTDELEDLKEAIRISRLALECNPDQAECLYNLSLMLQKRYNKARNIEDFQEALVISKQCVDKTAMRHKEKARRLCHHASCLTIKFEIDGSLEDLDKAIDCCYEAVKEEAQGYVDRSLAFDNLSTVLMDRFERSGAVEDLEDAIAYSQKAMYEMDKENITESARLNTFSNSIGRRYFRKGSRKDLNKAIQFARTAFDAESPSHAARRRYGSNLAHWLLFRYDRSKESVDLEEAIEIYSQALEDLPKDHADHLTLVSNYGQCLLRRGNDEDVDEAIEMLQEAIKAAHVDDPALAPAHLNSGLSLKQRFKSKSDNADLVEALGHFTLAAQDKKYHPLRRIEALKEAADLYAQQSHWTAAYQLLATAVGLLPMVGIRGLSWDDRQYILRKLSPLSSYAASIALNANQSPAVALALQEAGRGVIATSIIDSRTNFLDLKAADPDLYKEYSRLRDAASFAMSSQTQKNPADGLTTRSRSIRQLETFEKKVREETGLKTFGLTFSPTDLMRVAKHGHIVSFNVTGHRSDAFLVSRDKIELLQLPNLLLNDLRNMVRKLGELTSGSPESHQARNEEFCECMKWLWNVAVQPVLRALNLLTSRKDEPLPRLWWVMSGLLGQTPLHAAGSQWEKSTENTASHVISSYIPTFKYLARSRETSSDAPVIQALGVQVVAMPQTAEYSDLGTAEEITSIRNSIKEIDVLQNPTKASVLHALPRHPVIHFACHGVSDATDPSDSCLLLRVGPDGRPERLMVRELIDVSLPLARIAYLSACSTAQHRVENLREEVIHVASAFQLIGFPHVLGTLWEADDRAAIRMSGLFYQELVAEVAASHTGTEQVGDLQVAYAHHRAAQRLRRGEGGLRQMKNVADDVITWATFVHLGC